MFDESHGLRHRFVIPGELMWRPLDIHVQLLRQLDISVPRFTRLAVGLVVDSQNCRSVNHTTYTRLREFVMQEMRENAMEQYFMMREGRQLDQTVHQLIDTSAAIANNLRRLLHSSLGLVDRSLMVEDVILPRLDVVVSYDSSDLDVQPAAAVPPEDGGAGIGNAHQQTADRRPQLPPMGRY